MELTCNDFHAKLMDAWQKAFLARPSIILNRNEARRFLMSYETVSLEEFVKRAVPHQTGFHYDGVDWMLTGAPVGVWINGEHYYILQRHPRDPVVIPSSRKIEAQRIKEIGPLPGSFKQVMEYLKNPRHYGNPEVDAAASALRQSLAKFMDLYEMKVQRK